MCKITTKNLIDEELEELHLIDKVLRKYKIYDIEVYYTPRIHKLTARDSYNNKWKGKEFYDFLFDEVFNYNDEEIINLLCKEDDERLRYFRAKYQ